MCFCFVLYTPLNFPVSYTCVALLDLARLKIRVRGNPWKTPHLCAFAASEWSADVGGVETTTPQADRY